MHRRTPPFLGLLLVSLAAARAHGQSIVTIAGGGSDDGRSGAAVRFAAPAGIALAPNGDVVLADADANRVRRVSAAGVVSTVAGTGFPADNGDGGPATHAALYAPFGVAFDAAGRLLVADSAGRSVRAIDANGTITTVAGGSIDGNVLGDGGPATAAFLDTPYGLAFDSSGNLYIATALANRVRRVDHATGVITTVAGNGTAASSGDGGPATAAQLSFPVGVALDPAGNLFVAELHGNRVRRVDAATGVITTVAGDGTSTTVDGKVATATGLYQPGAVLVGTGGELFIGGGDGVFRVDAGGVIRRAVALGNVRGLARASATALYASTLVLGTLERVDLGAGTHTVVAGGATAAVDDGGPATAAVLYGPAQAVAAPGGDLYVVETSASRVRKVDAASGRISTYAGTGVNGSGGDGGPATRAQLASPSGAALDASGNLFIASGDRIRRVDAASGVMTSVAGGGNAPPADGVPATQVAIGVPYRVAVDRNGGLLYTENLSRRVWRVRSNGTLALVAGNGGFGSSGDGGPATQASFRYLWDVAADASGNVYVSDLEGQRLRRIDAATGNIASVVGGGAVPLGDGDVPGTSIFTAPQGLAFQADGKLLYEDGEGVVARYDPATGLVHRVAGVRIGAGTAGDGGPALQADLTDARSVSADAAGNVFVAQFSGGRVRAVLACVSVAPPALAAPADGAATAPTSAALSWAAVPGAFRYDVLVDTANPPVKIVAADLAATSFAAANLAPGTTHHWQVVAKGDPFCAPRSTAASAVRSFTTGAGCAAPPAPGAVAPANGASSVSSAPTLAWTASAGASTYDLYFGATNPPPLYAAGLTTTSAALSGLVASSTYSWSVTAHAACDAGKTSSSSIFTFRVAGSSCASPGAFPLSAPADGAAGVAATATLSWSASAGATSYELDLGVGGATPLYLAGIAGTSYTVRGLSPGATYSWRVVARTSCDAALSTLSAVRTFTVAGTCSAPGAPAFRFVPPGPVGAGQTYVLSWSDAPGLDSTGAYLVERSTSQTFATVLDAQAVSATFAAFVAAAPGTLYHRVRAVPGCDPTKAGPSSASAAVTVVDGRPDVVFTANPSATIASLGDRLEDMKTSFTLENISSSPVQVILARQELASVPFFQIVDPAGGDAGFVTLAPKTPKTFQVRFSGPPNDHAGSYQGLVVLAATGQGLAVTPYAFVNLKVGGSAGPVPEVRVGGQPVEYASFPGFAGDDAARPPITVDVFNPGTAPMELAAEIGPEVWLALEPGWNAQPVPPGGTRSIRLSTRRSRAPNGSALPRYTYLTLRTRDGQTARVLVEDADAPSLSLGRSAPLDRSTRSTLLPSVVKATSRIGNTFVSRIRLSSSGTDPVQAELFYTPASSQTALVDGFDAQAVRHATVVVPPGDVVNLTDPLVQLFGLTPPVSGSLEVVTAPEKAGFLTVTSSVDAPAVAGGTFGFQMPALPRGTGARVGSPHVVTGITSTAALRTNLILAETTGLDACHVNVALRDRSGTLLGQTAVDVPRYGQRQINAIVETLSGAAPFTAGRVEVEVLSGGGSVAAVATVIDNVNDDASTYVGVPANGAPAGAAPRLAFGKAGLRALAPSKTQLLVPAIVNGFQTFLGTALPYTFRSMLGLSSGTAAPATFVLTYHDLVSGASIRKTVTVNPRATVEYANVVEELFGLPSGTKSQGPVTIEADANGIAYCRVYSELARGSLGDAFPVLSIPAEGFTSAGDGKPLVLDGLEQSVDRARGTRSNLILNEVTGVGSATVNVRLYEAGNRATPIAEKDFTLAAGEKVQLSTVFGALGLETPPVAGSPTSPSLLKDRTNVQCVVTAKSGTGFVAAVVTTIDNKTGDTKNALLVPSGGTPAPSIGF